MIANLRSVIIIVTTVFFVYPAFSQQSKSDSLSALLNNASNKEKMDIYSELALMQRGVSYSKLIEYSNSSYKLAVELNDHENMITQLMHMGIASVYTGNYDTALILLKEAMQIADSLGMDEQHSMLTNNIGQVYLATNKNNIALGYYLEAYNYYQKIDDKQEMARLLINIAAVYYSLKDYDKSLANIQKSRSLFIGVDDTVMANNLLSNIGQLHSDMQNYDSAYYYFRKGLKITVRDNNLEYQMYLYNNIGLVDMNTGKKMIALQNLKKSVDLSLQINYPYQTASSLLNIAELYLKFEDVDSAFLYVENAKIYVMMTGNDEVTSRMHQYYYEIYKATGKPQKALDNFIAYSTIEDSLQSLERLSRIDELQIQFETANKELEINRLTNEVEMEKVRRFWAILLSVALLLLVVFVVFYFRQKRKSLLLRNSLIEKDAEILKEKLALQNKDLACKALNLAQVSQMKQSLIGELKKLTQVSNADGKKQIFSIIKNIGSDADKQAWDEFEARFEQVFSGFYNNLTEQYPDLSPSERKVCAFLKLNMSTKEIAALLHVSDRTVESTRYNIRRKINLNTEDNLITHLQTL